LRGTGWSWVWFAIEGCCWLAAALLLSAIWGRSYPEGVFATTEDVRNQVGLIKDLAIAGLPLAAGLFGIAGAGFLYSRNKDASPGDQMRLRKIATGCIWLVVSLIFGLPLLLNVVLKPELMHRLPLAIWSIRTGLILQWIFMFAFLRYVVVFLKSFLMK